MNFTPKLAFKSIATIGLFTLSQFASSQPNIADYIQSAVDSSDRSEAMTARDEARKPAEILALSGVKPGDKVVEFAGFGQYYTTLLSEIVGDAGSISMYDLPYTEERAGENSRAFVASHKNTSYSLVDYNEIALPDDVDVVFNVLYYHDLPLNNIDVAALNSAIYDSLVPGGVFFIIDHNAEPGSATRDTESIHRIGAEVIINEVMAAGFTLSAISNSLANPNEDQSIMVFAPGTRGATDRTVLKFVKPE